MNDLVSSPLADISIIIPTYNEAESLVELQRKLSLVYPASGSDVVEFIYIDDGSTDGTKAILVKLQIEDSRIRVLRFKKNLGKTIALAVGFRACGGKLVVTIDADLQNDPEDIPNLIKQLSSGSDLVCGWRHERHDPVHKTFPSLVINRIVQVLTRLKLHDINCGLKAMRREVPDSLNLLGKQHRYIPLKAHFGGYTVTEMPIRHYPRKHGHSKYGFTRFIEGIFDLITVIFMGKFDRSPFYLFGGFGLLLFVIGMAVLGYLSIGWLFGQWIGSRPLFGLAVLLVIFGFQLMSIGLLAELFISLLTPGVPAHWEEITRTGQRQEEDGVTEE